MHTRDDAWLALDRSHKAFMDSLGHLTEEELTATQVVGKWSAKDVVAHVWTWVEEAVQTVKDWEGRRTWQEGVTYDDAWNERQVNAKSTLPLISVEEGLITAHRRLMYALDAADDAALSRKARAPWENRDMPLVEFFYSMAAHYQHHATDLKNYQERCLEGCD